MPINYNQRNTNYIQVVRIGDKYYAPKSFTFSDNTLVEGRLVNNITVRQSIDVIDQKFKISNVKISLDNSKPRVSDFDTNYMHEEVEVYIKKDTDNAIENLESIFLGKVVGNEQGANVYIYDVEDETSEKVQRDLPQTYTPDNEVMLEDYKNKPVPMVYGEVDRAPLVIDSSEGKYNLRLDTEALVGIGAFQNHSIFTNVTISPFYLYVNGKYYQIPMTLAKKFSYLSSEAIQQGDFQIFPLNQGINNEFELVETDLFKHQTLQLRNIGPPNLIEARGSNSGAFPIITSNHTVLLESDDTDKITDGNLLTGVTKEHYKDVTIQQEDYPNEQQARYVDIKISTVPNFQYKDSQLQRVAFDDNLLPVFFERFRNTSGTDDTGFGTSISHTQHNEILTSNDFESTAHITISSGFVDFDPNDESYEILHGIDYTPNAFIDNLGDETQLWKHKLYLNEVTVDTIVDILEPFKHNFYARTLGRYYEPYTPQQIFDFFDEFYFEDVATLIDNPDIFPIPIVRDVTQEVSDFIRQTYNGVINGDIGLEYFAEVVYGYNIIFGGIMTNPIDIITHIVMVELEHEDIDWNEYKIAKQLHNDWIYAFSVTQDIDSKDLIQEISEHTKSIPRFKNDGKFGFVTIKDTYNGDDYINAKTIDNQEILDYKYDVTPLENLVTEIGVKYKKDYETNTLIKNVWSYFKKQYNRDKYYRYNLVPSQWNRYNIENEKDYYKDIECKYTRSELTAEKIYNFYFEQHKHTHLLIELSLPIKYSNLEIGDLIKINELIDDTKAFGYDYKLPHSYNGSQYVYPLFLVTSVKKSIDNVELTLYQLHHLAGAIDEYFYQNGLQVNTDNFPESTEIINQPPLITDVTPLEVYFENPDIVLNVNENEIEAGAIYFTLPQPIINSSSQTTLTISHVSGFVPGQPTVYTSYSNVLIRTDVPSLFQYIVVDEVGTTAFATLTVSPSVNQPPLLRIQPSQYWGIFELTSNGLYVEKHIIPQSDNESGISYYDKHVFAYNSSQSPQIANNPDAQVLYLAYDVNEQTSYYDNVLFGSDMLQKLTQEEYDELEIDEINISSIGEYKAGGLVYDDGGAIRVATWLVSVIPDENIDYPVLDGDITLDGIVNILDVVTCVNCVLSEEFSGAGGGYSNFVDWCFGNFPDENDLKAQQRWQNITFNGFYDTVNILNVVSTVNVVLQS